MILDENNKMIMGYAKSLLADNVNNINPIIWNAIVEKYGEEQLSQLQFNVRRVHDELMDEIAFQNWVIQYALDSVGDLYKKYRK